MLAIRQSTFSSSTYGTATTATRQLPPSRKNDNCHPQKIVPLSTCQLPPDKDSQVPTQCLWDVLRRERGPHLRGPEFTPESAFLPVPSQRRCARLKSRQDMPFFARGENPKSESAKVKVSVLIDAASSRFETTNWRTLCVRTYKLDGHGADVRQRVSYHSDLFLASLPKLAKEC
ncbi:hypothetical protein Ddc_12323 [Ditylenchus destructor]|nr:hypothetical protein Ddc_12323 [Ditylenchus destructor]